MSNHGLKIALVASEFDPLAKTGGLADVVSALAKNLSKKGHEVKVFLPKYKSVYQTGVQGDKRSGEITIGIGEGMHTGRWEVYHPKPCAHEFVFIVNDPLFHRDELYRDSHTGLDYRDNDSRFIFFNRAVLESMKQMNWRPDVIHCNDWQAALIPAYLKTSYSADPFFRGIATALTIHNLAYQGLFERETFQKLGVPPEFWTHPSAFEFWGKVNFLKAGIENADVISTVSERYAVEIQSSHDFGFGLEGVLRQRNSDIFGILNGVDYDTWRPSTDPFIWQKFDVDDLKGKKVNKQELLKKAGLPHSKDKPLIGVISRLVDQKGIELFLEIADDILNLEVNLIVLGDGDRKFVEPLKEAEKRHPKKMRLYVGFDNELAHQIEAASDIYLMPSRYEPCGLNQMYSLRYGAAPIVRETGGLADTISDYNPVTGEGVGFVFKNYSSDELLEAFCRALDLYADKNEWKQLITRGMKLDFSWERAVVRYEELYRRAQSSPAHVAA